MPIFDDPNKELNRLQEELLADDDLADLDDLLKDYEPTNMEDIFEKEHKEPKPPKHHGAPKTHTEAMSDMLLDEEEEDLDEDDFEDEGKEEKPAKPKKEKGIGGLVALCAAETVAIVGLLLWWLLWLR